MGYGGGGVAAVAAAMMVRGNGRGGITGDAATRPEMITESLIGAHGMRDDLRSEEYRDGNRHGRGTELRGVERVRVDCVADQEVGASRRA